MPTCTAGSTTTTHYGFCKPADGETNWGTAYRTSMDAIDTAIFNTGIPRSYLAGLQTTPTSAATSVSIAVGVAMGNDQSTSISLTSTLVKVLTSAWAVGTGNGGLYAATTIQGLQTYHVLAIIRTDTGVVDAYFDTVATGVNIPSPYTVYRRIASFTTDASKNIRSYTQDGDYFRLAASVLDVNQGTPGTNALTLTLASIPSGANMLAFFNTVMTGPTATRGRVYLSDLAANDETPSETVAPLICSNNVINDFPGGSGSYQIRTSVAAQIRARFVSSDAGANFKLATLGWWDTRGRNA
jgi:hypothetical protein